MVNSTIQLHTDLLGKVEVPVRAQLQKPAILTEGLLNFGLKQIGTSYSRNVTIYNPTSETMEL